MQHSKFVPKIFLVRQQSFLFCHKSKRCATGPKSKDFGITLWAIKQNQAQSPDSALDLNWITWCAPLFFLPASLDFLLKGFNFKTSVLENLITQRRGKSEIFMGGLGIFAALGTGGYTIYGGGVEWQVSRGCVLNLQFQFENNKLSPSIKSCARKAARLSYPRRCLHCCPLPSLPVSLPSHRASRSFRLLYG